MLFLLCLVHAALGSPSWTEVGIYSALINNMAKLLWCAHEGLP